jgi:hypothetical protein
MPSTVLGLKELNAEVQRVAKDLEMAEDPAAMEAAKVYLKFWRQLVPVLDANYQSSLVTTWLPTKGAAVGISWLGSLPRDEQPVLYAKRLEFGDHEITAQPSARPAQEAGRGEALEAAGVPLTAVIKGRRSRRRKPTT